MTDFLLELLSEEIPARMQARARADLERLFAAELAVAGLAAAAIQTFSTPRRLALIARGLADETAPVREERRGPRADAPEQAIAGFLGATGLALDQLATRDDKKGAFLYAVIETPGRATRDILSEAIPRIVRDFPWPKSMRWGDGNLRWVRPLHNILTIFGQDTVPVAIPGVPTGAATVGHRFHHPGPITIGGADDYAEKLRACHVILDHDERATIIRDRAHALAVEAGLTLVEDEALVIENAALTEWPVPLLGSFDEAFLDVPPEVITLTMRTNQKYFALKTPPRERPFQGRYEGDHAPEPKTQEAGGGAELRAGDGSTTVPRRRPGPSAPSGGLGGAGPRPSPGNDALAPNFICTANIDATDGGAAIVAGNRKVLAARLADAKFFWEQDRKTPLEEHARKLDQIVFHEKLGTVADKVDRVAKLARWLVEEGIVTNPSPPAGEGQPERSDGRERGVFGTGSLPTPPAADATSPSPAGGEGLSLADLAETAARLCKADLVTQMVGEFPELQGVMGGHYARAEDLDPRIAAAIRDHYKPAGQGDDVPTDPVTVAMSLADKLDTLVCFFAIGERPTGSKDPFALRRSAISIISLVVANELRAHIASAVNYGGFRLFYQLLDRAAAQGNFIHLPDELSLHGSFSALTKADGRVFVLILTPTGQIEVELDSAQKRPIQAMNEVMDNLKTLSLDMVDFLADRLKVQQREAGVRHDLIDAVFALGGEDDLVRLLARVRALQSFVETPEGADLLAGYKRAANILKKEGWLSAGTDTSSVTPAKAGVHLPASRPDATPEMDSRVRGNDDARDYPPEQSALIAALDAAEPAAAAAIEAEDFEGAMAALAGLRAPIDSFFDHVTVNDPDPATRAARLALLARIRDAIHRVADFSKIDG